jgi:hypothetical protein
LSIWPPYPLEKETMSHAQIDSIFSEVKRRPSASLFKAGGCNATKLADFEDLEFIL